MRCERGQHLARDLKGPFNRREDTLSDEVGRMFERIRAVEADARHERIGHDREDVPDLAFAIVVRHRLHRRRARRDHEIVLAARDLTGDGDAGRHVALRVEPIDRQRARRLDSPRSASASSVPRTPSSRITLLACCSTATRSDRRRGRTRTSLEVGEEEGRRQQPDQAEAGPETLGEVQHWGPQGCKSRFSRGSLSTLVRENRDCCAGERPRHLLRVRFGHDL